MAEALVKDAPEEITLHDELPDEPEALDPPDDADNDNEPDESEEEEPEDQPAERYVPHQALHAERMRRQQLQREIEMERRANAQRNGVLQGRLDEINRHLQQRASPVTEEPEPDMEKDPAKWVQYNFRRMQEQNARLERELQETKQYFGQQEQEFRRYIQESTQDQGLKSAVRSDESEFASQVPDYYDAIDYMTEMRHRELEALGNYDAKARNVMIAQEVKNLALVASQQGISPAEAAYNIAKARGFSSQPKRPSAPKLDNIRKGQQAARSMSAAPGAAPRGALTLDNLANMDASEFSKLVPDFQTFKKLHMR